LARRHHSAIRHTRANRASLWLAYVSRARSLSILNRRAIQIDGPVPTGAVGWSPSHELYREPRPRHLPADGAFDRLVATLWVLSEIAFDVFRMFVWAAPALFFLKAVT